MFERIMGIVTLKAPTYKAVAEDKSLTQEAMMIVIVVALLNNLASGVVTSSMLGTSMVGGLVKGVILAIFGVISWYVTAWVLAFVAKQFFQGKTETSEMLRVTGYVYVFNLVGVLVLLSLITPALACLVGIVGIAAWVLSLVGFVIGVREAAEFSTGNAVVTAIIAIVAMIIVGVIGGAIGTAITGMIG